MSEHQYEFIKKRLAPCGLHCGKCFAFTEEDICNQNSRLKESLGNFDVYAERLYSICYMGVAKGVDLNNASYSSRVMFVDVFGILPCLTND